MFVRTITDRASRRNTLNDLGLTSGSNPIVCLNEFAYKRGTEIHGENEPADYVYQVKKVPCGATSCFLMEDARLARFTWLAIFLD